MRHQPVVALLAASLLAIPAAAQTKIKRGFNVFSAQQDVEIGQQSAQEVEGQLPLVNDARVQAFVEQIGAKLAAHAPGPDFPYAFKVVNASDLNAFALPGGPVYLNRGVIESARTEGEVAGVLAHEIAHVGLRHGTHEASKQYLAQAGFGLLGGLIGKDARNSDVAQIVGGFGLNALFLKYSREAESQADVAGVQIMTAAGYSPSDMASFFDLLQQADSRRSVEWLSSHPTPSHRQDRIREEARLIGAPSASTPSSRAFLDARAALARMRPAPTTTELKKGATSGTTSSTSSGTSSGTSTSTGTVSSRRRTPVQTDIELPSRTNVTFRDDTGVFQVRYPSNWRVDHDEDGMGVTLTPPNGVLRVGNRTEIVVGAIIDHYEPFGTTRRPSTLFGDTTQSSDATADLVDGLLRSQRHLRQTGSLRRIRWSDNVRGLAATLAGVSPSTGIDERVVVATRELEDGHLLYVLFVAPAADVDQQRVLDTIMGSLSVRDEMPHPSGT